VRISSVSLAFALAATALPAARGQQPTATAASPLTALDDVGAAIVEKVARSVVLIDVDRPPTTPRRLTAMELGRMGLGNAYDPRYFSRPDEPCTGVVIGPGLIATTTWNVEGDGAVAVITPDGARVPARRLGRDENLDVALLAVDAPGLEPIAFASGPPVVGRFLFLVGRTAANDPLVTEGIVSGLNRHRGDSFAHSARTSYQNVGGALVDIDGKLVGIGVRHTDRASQGQASGVGFGASVVALQGQLTALAKGDVIPRRKTAFLGVSSDQEAVDVGGVRINAIVPNTAAQKAGLQAGDIIKIFNNVELRDFMHLREEIEKLTVGAEIVISVKRGEQDLDITLRLGARPEED
jgi:S1-C subfamily serine protease